MKNMLIDAGPLIALFDRGDQYHFRAIQFIRDYQGQLWTTWSVATEVSHMLDFNVLAQSNFLQWID